MRVLDVRNLTVSFRQDGAEHRAVKGVSFHVDKGETVALVGESGSGKSVTALSTVSLLPDSARVTGSVTYEGREMVGASPAELRATRAHSPAEVACARVALTPLLGRVGTRLTDPVKRPPAEHAVEARAAQHGADDAHVPIR